MRRFPRERKSEEDSDDDGEEWKDCLAQEGKDSQEERRKSREAEESMEKKIRRSEASLSMLKGEEMLRNCGSLFRISLRIGLELRREGEVVVKTHTIEFIGKKRRAEEGPLKRPQ